MHLLLLPKVEHPKIVPQKDLQVLSDAQEMRDKDGIISEASVFVNNQRVNEMNECVGWQMAWDWRQTILGNRTGGRCTCYPNMVRALVRE